MIYRVLLLSCVSLLALSGCESMGMQEYNPFGQKSADPMSVDNVQMRMDKGEVTPLPQASYGTGNSSVDIFNDGYASQNYQSNEMMQQGMPSYSGGMPAMGDSSVTIFPIDGSPPMMGAAASSNYYADNNFGQSNYTSYDSSGNQIFFENGSSRLGSGDLRKLSTVAEQAKFAPVNRITVAGYASRPTQAGSQTVEGHILNLKESMNRSFAVSKELMKKGVPAEKIKAVSWGATKPTGNDAQDRRVDIVMGEQ